ncbi:MAG: hypothetical protein J7L47_05105 [Candidatus Odinarchaeota archaeon]|nr:hypothetical protein [Candidatus Odinarchaeota archaeon]
MKKSVFVSKALKGVIFTKKYKDMGPKVVAVAPTEFLEDIPKEPIAERIWIEVNAPGESDIKQFFCSVTDSLAFCKPFKLLSDNFAICIYFKTDLFTEEPEVMEVITEAIETAIEKIKKGESFSKVVTEIFNDLK